MQHNNPANTNRLIAVAQTTACPDEREQAVLALWQIHGDRLTGIMAKTSYRISSDFSCNGYSSQERQRNLAGNAFMVFQSAVMAFDSKAGVPFAAYIAQKGNWHIMDEKRSNSIRSKYERSVDFSMEGVAAGSNPDEARNLALLREAIACEPDFEDEIDSSERLAAIYKLTEVDLKLRRYFVVSLQLVNEGIEYSDAEVARRLGCSRANVGLYKKKLLRLIRENGLLDGYRPRA